MHSLLKASAISLAAVGSLTLPTTPSFAQDTASVEAARRVNLAGGQRILSQQIAMSACFVSIGVDHTAHFARLENAHLDFTRVNDALRNGSDELGLEQEGYRSVIEALDAADSTWSDYQEMVDGFRQIRMMTPDVMVRFDERGLVVLDDMNIAVTTIANSYSANLEALPQILALTIDFAGRQSMLTQKMAKEFCMISAGINVEENRARLTESHDQFNSIHAALVDGIPHLITPAPTPEILAHLHDVETAWEQQNLIFTKVISGEDITLEDRRYVSENIDAVLAKMNDTVALYEDVHGLPNF